MILNLDSNSFLLWTKNLYLFCVWLVKTMTSQTTFFLIISLVKQVLQIQSFCFLSSYSIFGHSLSSINYLYLEYTTHTKFLKKCQQNIHSLSVFFCCCYLRKCGVTWISTRRHQNKLLWGRCDLLITVI